jgi:hypothetical protein
MSCGVQATPKRNGTNSFSLMIELEVDEHSPNNSILARSLPRFSLELHL